MPTLKRVTTRWVLVVCALPVFSFPAHAQYSQCWGRWDIGFAVSEDASRDLCGNLSESHEPVEIGWNAVSSPEMQYRVRLNTFVRDLEKFRRLGIEVGTYRYAPMNEAWAIADLRDRSKDLRRTTDRVIDFVDWGFDYPPARVLRTPQGNPYKRVIEAASMVERVLPRVWAVTAGYVLDIELHREVRRELFEIKAFSEFEIETDE